MSFIGDAISTVAGALTGSSAAEASKGAADTAAQAEMAALDYLKQTEKLPQQFREGALGLLGGLYGLEGGTSGAAQRLQSSPLYQATIGQIPAQEKAILRNQSATGALRTGGTDQMLAENQRMNQLQAYQNALQPLQGLASLPSNANQIAGLQSGIGQTLAQGQVGAAQAQQQGISNTLGLGMNALALAGFSDIRLKENIQPAGERYGQSWFTWDWNEKAKSLGISGSAEGVIADYVKQTRPELIGERNGYLTVDYGALANG